MPKNHRHLFVLSWILVFAAAPSRGEEWNIDQLAAPGPVLEYVAEEGTAISLDVSPNGEKIVFDLLGHLYEMPIDGGEARALTRGRSWNMLPRYSPDGKYLAFTSDRSGSDDVWLLDRESGELRNLSSQAYGVHRPTWSRDGRFVFASAFAADGGPAAVALDLRGGLHVLLPRPAGNLGLHPGRFVEAPSGRLYFENTGGELPASGHRIEIFHRQSGEHETYLERPGGAFNPALSPDGSYLSYQHRDGQRTVLVLRHLASGEERILAEDLDRDRQESGIYRYGALPGYAWHPDGDEIFIAIDGGIRAVNAGDGGRRSIPFRAPVRRQLEQTLRFPVEVPDGPTATRTHRFALRTSEGILFETLGDLFLLGDSGLRNLTDSAAHETSPVYDPASGTLYYATWSDDDLGGIEASTAESEPRRLTDWPSQYGSLALSSDGRTLAYLRGNGALRTGGRLQDQTDFTLRLRHDDGREETLTQIRWRRLTFANHAGMRPPTVTVDGDRRLVYFTEYDEDVLVLKQIGFDGGRETTLARFPHAVRAVPSADLEWILFREYERSYLTPFAFFGEPVILSHFDEKGECKRVDGEDGTYLAFGPDGETVTWTRGPFFYERSIADIWHDGPAATRTRIAVPFTTAEPPSDVALVGARILTMSDEIGLLERGTILISGNRITAVGTDVDVPPGAEVFDLAGQTVLPGLVDVHAHPDPNVSPLNVVEQRIHTLHAALAHGVTTMVEVYGTIRKDVWVSDMIRSGRMTGPRLLTVGPPMYGDRTYRPKLYRELGTLEDAADEVRYNRDQGATALKDYVNFDRRRRHNLITAARREGINVVSESAADPQMNLTQILDGVTGIEHSMGLTPLYDDVVRLFAASDAGITPTLLVVYNGPRGESRFHQEERIWENAKLLRFMTRDELLTYRRPTHHFADDRYTPEMVRAMKRLFDGGVSVQLGAHGQMPGLDAHWEMELFDLGPGGGGFPPFDILRIATLLGARYAGLDEDLGSLEPGKIADLIVLREDPLRDIRNSRSIRYVMKNGVLYDGDRLDRVYPDPQPAAPMYFKGRAAGDR